MGNLTEISFLGDVFGFIAVRKRDILWARDDRPCVIHLAGASTRAEKNASFMPVRSAKRQKPASDVLQLGRSALDFQSRNCQYGAIFSKPSFLQIIPRFFSA
jgi:hypothetical protein